MKEIAYSRSALRTLRRMPRNDNERITSKVTQYAEDPASLANNVTALQGRSGFRLRVGGWRVIFEETAERIDILVIGPRGSYG